MTYIIETEGGFWGALPKQAKGDIANLPKQHQQALTVLFAKVKEYAALSAAKNANDATTYKITLQDGKQVQFLQVNDAQLKYLPAAIAGAIIYISNTTKAFLTAVI